MKTLTCTNEVITRGSVILTAKPFVFILSSKHQGERCDFCFKRDNVMKCSGCRFVSYCDRNCQRQAWTDHSGECKGFKKISPRFVPDAARIMGKVINKLKKGGEKERGYINSTRFRMFKDLMSHYSDLKENKPKLEHFECLVAILASYLGQENLPNTAEMLGIYGRICVNSFSILDPEMLSLGTGIYLGPTIIDHSCRPNAIAVFEGTTIFIRAIEEMSAPLDWSKVRISYIERMNSTADRRSELELGYFFTCDCPVCLDVDQDNVSLRAVACPNSSCSSYVLCPETEQELDAGKECSKCKTMVSSSWLRKYHEEAQMSKEAIGGMQEVAYLDIARQGVRRHGAMFHYLNIIHVKMLDAAFESAIALHQWIEAEQYGSALLPAYKYYYGNFHPLLGILHLKLAKLQNLEGMITKARENLQEALVVLRVTHGRESTLYKDQIVPLLQQLSKPT